MLTYCPQCNVVSFKPDKGHALHRWNTTTQTWNLLLPQHLEIGEKLCPTCDEAETRNLVKGCVNHED